MKKNHFFLMGLCLLLSLKVWGQVPTNTSVTTATVVNTFPFVDSNVNSFLGGSNLGMNGGCVAACCSTVVYRVEIPNQPGTLRGDMVPFVPLAGSMLGYTPDIPFPTANNEVTFAPGPGNFCGFRDSIQINNLSGGEVFYVYCFNYNNQTTQGANSDISFNFIPDCPAGFNCGSISETICDGDGFITPSGNLLTSSGSYQDTLFGLAQGGMDSLIYISLTIEHQALTQDVLQDELVCDTILHPASTELVSYGEFHKADDDWVEINGVAPALAGTNRSAFMWMRQSTMVSGSSQVLLGINTSSGGNISNLQIGTNEQLGVFDGGTARYTSITVTDGQWHFVGYTYDEATNETKIYVDGVLGRTFSNGQSCTATSQFSLGQEFDGGNSLGNFFEGEMTEVSIWNEVLDSAEIASIMTHCIRADHPKYANLQGYYPMIGSCDSSAANVRDFSPAGNHGTAALGDIVVTDTLLPISNFNSVCHFNIEWERAGNLISTDDTLFLSPAIGGNYNLSLSRDYFEVNDPWVVTVQGGCGGCSPTTGSISPVACDSFTVPSGNATYTISGVYSDTLVNAGGCDSILTVNLTINNSVSVMQSLFGCDSIVFNGTTYFSPQMVVENFPGGAANGCDSTMMTFLDINSSASSTQSLTACDSAVINGTTYFSSQIVTDVFPSGAVNGCDSTVVTNLTINHSAVSNLFVTACDSAVVNGTTYFSSQVITEVFPGGAGNGCDSTVTTNLTINNAVTATQSLTACDSAVINGNTYFTSQIVTDFFPAGAANGCDSTLITNLTINNAVTATQSLAACDSATLNGNTYFTSQIVTDFFPAGASNGCDSTLVTNLTINNAVTATQSLTACDSATLNGNTYFASQIVTDFFPAGASNGCDSTLITNLTINNAVTTTQSLAACDSATLNGNTYFTSQIVTDFFPAGAANGCDSTLVTNLTINNAVTATQSLTACDSATLNGNTYFTSQIVTDFFPAGAANGCDSTLVTNLTINNAVTATQSLTACDSATLNGNTYFTSQIVTDFFPAGASNGCDSTLVTNLTINNAVSTTQSLTACDSATFNGSTYFTSQIVTDFFPAGASNGCDSTLITNLTINNAVTATQSLTACDTATINGQTYFTSQIVTDFFPAGAANGCDSTLITNLTINNAVTATQNLTACDSATFNGNTYFTSQIVTDFFPAGASNGCDSTLITNLTINNAVTAMQSLTACDTATINGVTYFTSQIVTDFFPAGATNGCDSTLVTNLTINSSSSFTQSLSLCDGSSITVGSNTYSSSGQYVDFLTSAVGCDSIVTTNLTILPPVNVNVSSNQDTLWAANSNATYQWYTCDNGNPDVPIPSATDQYYVATANGNYAVEVTEDSCSAFSSCTPIVVISSGESAFTPAFSVYPNPNQGSFYIQSQLPNREMTVRVFDQMGKLVLTVPFFGGRQLIELEKVTQGIYHVQLLVDGEAIYKTVMIRP